MGKKISQFQKKKECLICIDSDGCMMDTMDIKHIRCFGPCMVKEWKLEGWKDKILKRWNEINLYSMTRGINRFKGLLIALKEINSEEVAIEGLDALEIWVKEAKELSNMALENYMEEHSAEILKKAWNWSNEVNRFISELPETEIKPFNCAKEGLIAASYVADIAVVSSANQQAVEDEWSRFGLIEYTDVLLSQNDGSKTWCIRELLKKGYDVSCVLMVGDAPGDLQAAVENGVWYYPILAKKESESWKNFSNVALKPLIGKEFSKEYQQVLTQKFEENLKGEM